MHFAALRAFPLSDKAHRALPLDRPSATSLLLFARQDCLPFLFVRGVGQGRPPVSHSLHKKMGDGTELTPLQTAKAKWKREYTDKNKDGRPVYRAAAILVCNFTFDELKAIEDNATVRGRVGTVRVAYLS